MSHLKSKPSNHARNGADADANGGRSTSNRRSVYTNHKQLQFLQSKQKRKCFQGGRGSGKSTCLGGQTQMQFNYLPRAKVFIAGLTYNQILTKTLPAAMDFWSTVGLIEYDKQQKFGHYVVGCKPPADWFKPYQAPRNYDNCVSFINGFTIEMLSMDRADTARGGNFDGGHIDESALMKREIVGKVLMPMIRGNLYRFNHYLHQLFCDYSSAAWLPSGQWIYETEELARQYPDEYLYVESTAYDNIEVLGEQYIRNLEREMLKIEFEVEVLNKRLKKLPNSFYPAFDESKHCRYNTFYYQHDPETGLTIPTLSDCDPARPLDVSMDFNAAFTSCLIGQEHARECRILNCLFVKESKTNLVDELCDKFCDAYAGHPCKQVVLYGDPNGNSRSAGATRTFFQQAEERLQKRGWSVRMEVLTTYPPHEVKHRYINALLAEESNRLPTIRINQNTCKYLIISIQNSPITPEWKKDKSSEQQLIEQERATHLSDVFDYYLYKKYAHLFGNYAGSYQVRFM